MPKVPEGWRKRAQSSVEMLKQVRNSERPKLKTLLCTALAHI